MRNYAVESDVSRGADEVIRRGVEAKRASMLLLFFLGFVIVGAAGFLRFYYGRRTEAMKSEIAVHTRGIDAQIKALNLKKERLERESKFFDQESKSGQFAAVARVLKDRMLIRTVGYDVNAQSVESAFFFETGLRMEQIVHSGLWRFEGVVLNGGAGLTEEIKESRTMEFRTAEPSETQLRLPTKSEGYMEFRTAEPSETQLRADGRPDVRPRYIGENKNVFVLSLKSGETTILNVLFWRRP